MEVYMKELDKIIERHIKMLNYMIAHKDEDDIIHISQSQIAEHIEVGRTTVKNMMKRLNTLDICIEMIGKSRYKVNYIDIKERGVFKEILRCLPQYLIWMLDDSNKKTNYIEKAKLLNTEYKIVEIIEGYIVYEINHFQD